MVLVLAVLMSTVVSSKIVSHSNNWT